MITVITNSRRFFWTGKSKIGPVLEQSVGVRYVWGGGSFLDVKDDLLGVETRLSDGTLGYDCSGYIIHASVLTGKIDLEKVLAAGITDSAIVDLADMSDPTYDLDKADWVLYRNRHGMMNIGGGMVIGASGGWSSTHGNNSKAVVQVRPFNYRTDVLCGCVFKEKYK